MSQHAPRFSAAPSQLRTPHESVEILPVEPFENVVQVVILALWTRDELTPADLPHQLRLPADVAPVQVQPIPVAVYARDRLAIELSEENVCQGFGHRRGRSREQVGDADVQPAFFEADEAVGI